MKRGAAYLVDLLLGKEYQDDWQPSQSDIAWTKRLFDTLNDGGFWHNSEGVFRIDKQKKELLYAGPKGQIFHRVGKTAQLLGYTVRHVGDNPDEKSFSA